MRSTLKIVMTAFTACMVALMVAGAGFAANIPKIMPADPNSIPGHEQINKGMQLLLTLFILFLIGIIIACLIKIIKSLNDGNGMPGGTIGALILSVILLGLTATEGTGYFSGWANYFGG